MTPPDEAISVLLVDDDPAIVEAVSGYLQEAGFTVRRVSNGEAARATLLRGECEVVITDLAMPMLGGFGLVEAAQVLEEPPEFIVLTAAHKADASSAIRALRLGVHDFLAKPPRRHELVSAVESAVAKRRERQTKARMLVELENLSRTDALTGLLNRRAFDEALQVEQARARRHGTPLSLLILDIDKFKCVNDTYGHGGGDDVLRRFAEQIGAMVRTEDGAYRLGGEEFAVLLPLTHPEGALDLARRMVQSVADVRFSAAGRALRVTCSAGVATAMGPDASGLNLLARADAGLYRAKDSGRNRACAADEKPAVARRATPVPA